MRENISKKNDLHVTDAKWFAVRTNFKAEKQVCKRLAEKEIEVYLPLLEVVRRYQSKNKKVLIPLINTYVFVKITKDEYVTVLEDFGVRYFLKTAKELVAIPDEEIEIMRRVVGEKVDVDVNTLSYAVGEAVEIVGGQLTGLKGKLVEIKGKNSFVIELVNAGFELIMQVEPSYLRKVTLSTYK